MHLVVFKHGLFNNKKKWKFHYDVDEAAEEVFKSIPDKTHHFDTSLLNRVLLSCVTSHPPKFPAFILTGEFKSFTF